jgi:hypothetical protein
MAGSFVRDAQAPDLLAGVTTTTAAGANQAGTPYEIGWSDLTQFVLVPTAKSGTTPAITVVIQGSESPTFAAGTIVTLGTIVATDPTLINSRYVRAVSTVTGTSGTITASVTPVPAHDRWARGISPSTHAVV